MNWILKRSGVTIGGVDFSGKALAKIAADLSYCGVPTTRHTSTFIHEDKLHSSFKNPLDFRRHIFTQNQY